MDGEVVYYFLYDIGALLDIENVKKLDTLLIEKLDMSLIEIKKSAPKYVKFPKYLCFKFEERDVLTNRGRVHLRTNIKLFPIGVISYEIRIEFSNKKFESLFSYYTIKIIEDNEEISLEKYVEKIHKEVLQAVKENIIEPYGIEIEPETHTVFCIKRINEMEYKKLHARNLASLLANDEEIRKLSDDIIKDRTKYSYSYYDEDLIVIDWDSAIIVEPSGKYNDILFTIELANLQLLELRTYDKYFDTILAKAYDDVEKFLYQKNIFKSPRKIIEELSKTKIDLTKVTDYISNISKFFGDWYLAKIYGMTSERFYLSQWEERVNSKMEILNSLYLILNQENANKKLLILELLIVIFFLVDIILILAGYLKT
ncbi:MAG: hypothetical protein H5T44_03670 [Thermoplasmatales archaeon]|nr:hypothetical protein [Thermoplasmatales archaeon]